MQLKKELKSEKIYTTKDIQETLIGILKDIDSFCKENKIEYYLMGGSALGAMRHKGFIPWDDDIDLFMTYENYHKFINLFKENTIPGYYLEEENTDIWPLFITQVKKNGTTLINKQWENNKNMHCGIAVDIMCLYSAPNNDILRRIQYTMAMCLKVNALARVGYQADGIGKKIIMALSKIIVNDLTRPFFINYVSRYEKKNTDYYGHFFGRARYKYTSFPKSYVGKQRYVEFENTKFPVFENVEKYLETRYGSKWGEMPDKDTLAQYPAHASFVDLETDYREYIG